MSTLTPEEMIERYAHDVARRLPKKMRADVQAELRALLTDSLRERGGDADTASKLLLEFGEPGEVALRYHTPAPIIEPADTRMFWSVTGAVIGMVGVIGFCFIVTWPHDSAAALRADIRDWSAEFSRLALMILGAMALIFWQIGVLRRNHPATDKWQPRFLPPVHDPNRIERLPQIIALVCAIVGTLVLISSAAYINWMYDGRAAPAAIQAFSYEPDFLATPGPLLLAGLIAAIGMQIWTTIEGRWRPLTLWIDVSLSVLICALMIWTMQAGPVFQSEKSNGVVGFAVALIIAAAAFDMFGKVRRLMQGRSAMTLSGDPVAR